MNGVGSKNSRLQPGSEGVPQTIALPFTTLTYRGDPSALRKSKATGTIGASRFVVPPFAGVFPSVLKSQVLLGAPLEVNPGVEYTPLKLGTESMPGMPGSVAWCSVQPGRCAVDAGEVQVGVFRECSGDLIGSRGLRPARAGDRHG
jgi:hypothetical protein